MTMELWPSCQHGSPCVLKTGTRPGPRLGRNFYICCKRPNEQCDFVQPVKVPPMTCPEHGEMVDVRVLADHMKHTVRYRCKKGSPWCGVTYWEEAGGGDKENVHPNYITCHASLEELNCNSEESGDLTLEEEEEEGYEVEDGEEEEEEGEGVKEEEEEGNKVEDGEEKEEEGNEVEEGEGEEVKEEEEKEEVKEEGKVKDFGLTTDVMTGSSTSETPSEGILVAEGEDHICGEEEEGTDSVVHEKPPSPQFKLGSQYRTLYRQLQQTETLLQTMAHRLPDGGEKLRAQRMEIMNKISQIKKAPPPDLSTHRNPVSATSAQDKLFQKGINLQARLLTSGVVEQLHSSLENCPGAETLAPQPARVTIPLFPHQRRALAWLLWREKQSPSGGILADEMGLGKTLSMISLILQNPSDLSHHQEGLVSSRATLVVCAPSLIHQWEREISSKVKSHSLSVLIYHGSRRTKYPQELAANDVVITTYDTIGSEGASALTTGEQPGIRQRRVASSTTLFQVYWYRIILDEAHKIRNPKTAMAIGVTGLKKVHRWAVTGTPVQNKLLDLYSLIRFLELAPFDDIREWKHSIERKSVVGMQRLRTMITVLMLRRTKEDISTTHKLPEKLIHTHTVDLSTEEQNVYDALFTVARRVFVRFLAEHKQGESVEDAVPSGHSPPSAPLSPAVQHCLDEVLHSVKGGHGAVLVMLLRLRQCCCHPALMLTGMQSVDVEEGLEESLQSLSLDHVPQKKSNELPPVFREQQLSTKICEVLREVRRIRALDPPEKCIIVSQWKRLLDIIRHPLDSAGISYTTIDSSVSPKQRNINMTKFNAGSEAPWVMLLSMVAGGEGLNLIGGNHVFMLDLHWNPAVELQATDRAHRVGQTRDVHVHRFVCRSTVEERIQLLQQKKLELSATVLSGASRPKHSKSRLTLEDLKILFQVQ